MPAIDPQVLLEEAKCYACYANASLADLLKLALLSRIAQAGGGGGGGSQTPWTSDIDGGCFNLNNVCKVNGVKVYRALLTQSGTSDPTVIVQENTLGAVTFAYDDTGTYLVSFPSPVSDVSKYQVYIQSNRFLGVFFSISSMDVTGFKIETGQFNGGVPAFENLNDLLNNTPIYILVYPATPQCPDCAS